MWGSKVLVDRNSTFVTGKDHIVSINVLEVGVTRMGSLTRHSRLKMSHKSSRSLPSLPFLSGWRRSQLRSPSTSRSSQEGNAYSRSLYRSFSSRLICECWEVYRQHTPLAMNYRFLVWSKGPQGWTKSRTHFVKTCLQGFWRSLTLTSNFK